MSTRENIRLIARSPLDDFQCINIFSIYANNFCGAGRVSILRYFKVCGSV